LQEKTTFNSFLSVKKEMRRFVDLLLLLALLLLMVYMVQARDTDGDGILDAGKMLLNQIIFYALFIRRLYACTTFLKLCYKAFESKSLKVCQLAR
jgi:hypothetical protein